MAREALFGAAQVAEAEADGYTLLLHHIGMATSATTTASFLWTATAFAPSASSPKYRRPSSPADFEPTDFAGLITYVKENADTITMAIAGIGAASHLCGMLFMQAIEAPLVTVPYRGTAPR